jgi:hypothetical protein
MGAKVHRPFQIIMFIAIDIWRRRCELSKKQKDLHMDVAPLSDTHLKHLERFLYQIITSIRLTASQEGKAELPLQ